MIANVDLGSVDDEVLHDIDVLVLRCYVQRAQTGQMPRSRKPFGDDGGALGIGVARVESRSGFDQFAIPLLFSWPKTKRFLKFPSTKIEKLVENQP